MGRLEALWYNHTSELTTGNIGRVGALMEYKIIDAEGNEIPRDQPGEICFRGPNVMLGKLLPGNAEIGYLDNEKATKESFTADGFLRTGDIGYVGENEFVYIYYGSNAGIFGLRIESRS
jgi:4-coumarate--CoA ligase